MSLLKAQPQRIGVLLAKIWSNHAVVVAQERHQHRQILGADERQVGHQDERRAGAVRPEPRQAIVDLIDAGATHIVIDMERVDFLDSTGLGVLVEGLKMIRPRGGRISMVITQDKIVKVFDITGLNKEFAIHGSLEAALREPVAGA